MASVPLPWRPLVAWVGASIILLSATISREQQQQLLLDYTLEFFSLAFPPGG